MTSPTMVALVLVARDLGRLHDARLVADFLTPGDPLVLLVDRPRDLAEQGH
jgi:hypothetical protein